MSLLLNRRPKIDTWMFYYLNINGKDILFCIPEVQGESVNDTLSKYAPEMLPYVDNGITKENLIEMWVLPDPIFVPYHTRTHPDTINYDHIIGCSQKEYQTPINRKIYLHDPEDDDGSEQAYADQIIDEMNRLLELSQCPHNQHCPQTRMTFDVIEEQAFNILPKGYFLSKKWLDNIAKEVDFYSW